MGTAVALNLPEATGGMAPFEYTLTGTLPAGLTFDGDAMTPDHLRARRTRRRPPPRSPTRSRTPTTPPYQEQFSVTVEAAALGDFSWEAMT